MNTLRAWFSALSTKHRIEYAVSLLWIIIVPFIAVPYVGEEGGPLEHFLWWGAFPMLLYWGRRFWVRKWF
ncbi:MULTISPECIES: hypothetical protein [Methylomonas]|nr:MULTISPECIES: hypothetical protein [Methylomonas]